MCNLPVIAYTISKLTQVMGHTLRAIVGQRGIRVSAGFYRIKARVNVVPGWRTHRRSLKTTSEFHPLLSNGIDMGCFDIFTAITSDVTVGQVICYDKYYIWAVTGCRPFGSIEANEGDN